MQVKTIIKLLGASVFVIAATNAMAQTHLYEFNGNLNDSLGGPSLSANGGSLGASAYSFGANQGLSLSNALSADVYTIDMTFSFAPRSSWSKIVDFNNLTADAGLYRYVDSSGAVLQICSCSNKVNSAFGAITDNQPVRITLTRDASQVVTQYVNGVSAGSYLDSGNNLTFNTSNHVAHFFMDDSATAFAEASAGSVSRIMIFDSALSSTAVANINAVPEPETYAMLMAGLVLIGGVKRRRNQRLNG